MHKESHSPHMDTIWLLIVFIGMQFTFTSLQPFREDKHQVALENRK